MIRMANCRSITAMMFLLLLSFVLGCGGGGGGDGSSTSTSSHSSNYVPPTVESTSITPANPVIPVGLDQQFKATQIWSDGSTKEISVNETWTSSNTLVATIDDLVYWDWDDPIRYIVLATAVAPGTTTITVNPTQKGAGSTTLTVSSATLSSISITPDQASWPAEFTQQFKAMGTYSDGRSYDITNKVTWSSSDASKVTVSSKGLATTLKAGTASITATKGGISGSTILTVSSATLSSILVTPVNPVIPVGLTQQFKAMGTYSDGASYDITNKVTWSSSDASKVTVSFSGLATSLKIAGTSTITATKGGISGSTILTAQGVVQTGLTVTVAWPQSFSGSITCQATATALYSDGTTKDVTTQVTWKPESSTVSVTQSGKVTIYGVGAAAVRATMGTFSVVESAYYYGF